MQTPLLKTVLTLGSWLIALHIVVLSSCVTPDPCDDVLCYQGDCIDGSCYCDPGMEGELCSIEIRRRFIGFYSGEFVLFGDSTSTEFRLDRHPKERNKMIWDEQYEMVVIDTSRFEMPEQHPIGAPNSYTLSGFGYVTKIDGRRQLVFHLNLTYSDTNYVTTFYGTR